MSSIRLNDETQVAPHFVSNFTTNGYYLSATVGRIVMAADIIKHDEKLAHHGDMLLEFGNKVWGKPAVDREVKTRTEGTAGVVNGTGGFGAAVELCYQARRDLVKFLGEGHNASEFQRMIEHIFDPTERNRVEGLMADGKLGGT